MEKNNPIKCKVCSREIPKSAATTPEGKDYVWNLCGECYIKWKSENPKDDSNK